MKIFGKGKAKANGTDFLELLETEKLRQAVNIDVFEFGMVASCFAVALSATALAATSQKELKRIQRELSRFLRAYSFTDGVIAPARDGRGIGFVVWMIARRRLLAAPVGTEAVRHSTHWSVFRELDGKLNAGDFAGQTKAEARAFFKAAGYDEKAGWSLRKVALTEYLGRKEKQ